MALGCFLWISGICFLLFNGSVGLPVMKGYGYPYNTDSKNMGDYVEDEALMSYDWQPSDDQPSAAAYTSYNRPAALWEPISVATQQTVPSAPAVESFVNSESRDWSLENPNSPLMFPLSHNYKPSKSPSDVSNTAGGAGQAGYTSTGSSTEYSSEPSYQMYPSNAGAQQVGSSATGYKPSNPAGPQPGPNTDSSTQGGGSQYVPHLVYEEVFQYPSENAEQSPSDGVSNTAGGAGYTSTGSSTEYSSEPSYQMYPSNAGAQQVGSSATGYKPSNPAGPQPGPNTDSSTQGGGSQYVPHLVYEEVFQYPSENAEQSPSDGVSNTAGGAGYTSTGSSTEYSSEPSYQMYPSNAGAQQVASSATGGSAPAQMSYQPQPVASPKEEVPVGVSEPILRPPPPPPPSYIIKYKDGFVRVRYLLNKSRYSPGLASGPAVRPAPARRQAAAPVAVKNPQRTRIHG